MNSKKKIQNKVTELLNNCQISEPPIDVETIVHCLGIDLNYVKFEDEEISGVLINKEGHINIGVNENHPHNRQRFTIAHEIGHYILHYDKPLFVDERFRDKTSSEGKNPEEIDANTFAAELLMPEPFIRGDMAQLKNWDEESIRELAKKYQVSAESLVYRLSNLGFELDL
jgi:Zn-dependent peptidase ImmA (M78 family)